MKHYIKLLRPKDWAKNLFLFVPSFFAGHIFTLSKIELLLTGFAAFSCIASSVYIINDYRDIENDRKHPTKRNRPLASGNVKPAHAIVICTILVIAAAILGYLANPSFGFLICAGGLFFDEYRIQLRP